MERMPEMIVIDNEINNPIFIIRPMILLRSFFPLFILLKYFLWNCICKIIKNNNPIATIT